MVLFHGTASRFISGIFDKGLIKKNRQHVHLSATKTTAMSVGRRHGKPVVLLVNSEQMHKDGCEFYPSKNGVWLTDSVPVQCISEAD